ncbi:hypothetical protein J4Q44_G00388940 [Coregonus suidteri]|uniref:Small vasohibin-binding protein n=1 Tax=Coregonus suidteri TaxID=861788 RepID=A0AAN8QIR1_9TELE
MESACRKDKPKLNSTPTRGDRAKQKSAQQELKQRQRTEIYALNKVMTELEQQQFEAFSALSQSTTTGSTSKTMSYISHRHIELEGLCNEEVSSFSSRGPYEMARLLYQFSSST